MPSWRLVDADPLAREHKYTFCKPSRELIATVKPGEVVKLIFEFDSDDPDAPGAERMWVRVTRVEPGPKFVGALDNYPKYIKDLAYGDTIEFEPCHVVNTEHDDADNLVEKYIARCFVTSRVLYDGSRVGYLYREEPDKPEDSGWRILAGDESEEYMDDPSHAHYVSLGAVLSRDDSFIHLLESPIGAEFERDPGTGEFVPAPEDE